jgi:hypothetical protein
MLDWPTGRNTFTLSFGGSVGLGASADADRGSR